MTKNEKDERVSAEQRKLENDRREAAAREQEQKPARAAAQPADLATRGGPPQPDPAAAQAAVDKETAAKVDVTKAMSDAAAIRAKNEREHTEAVDKAASKRIDDDPLHDPGQYPGVLGPGVKAPGDATLVAPHVLQLEGEETVTMLFPRDVKLQEGGKTALFKQGVREVPAHLAGPPMHWWLRDNGVKQYEK